ncbi:unnamed protein product [Citrullus colocynthis]|uniref:Uncharacterized protein n=1 Tax=Citrullus colocynthis TaxID=252529 RepID=A0ABP0XY82_9ROSI
MASALEGMLMLASRHALWYAPPLANRLKRVEMGVRLDGCRAQGMLHEAMHTWANGYRHTWVLKTMYEDVCKMAKCGQKSMGNSPRDTYSGEQLAPHVKDA